MRKARNGRRSRNSTPTSNVCSTRNARQLLLPNGERQANCLKAKEQAEMSPRSLWAMVQGDPVFMRRVNGWLTVFWIAMIPASYLAGWLNSVVYVSALSLWALVSGHWAAWQAARVEVAQDRELQRQRDEPIEERVVDKIVERTDVGAST